MIVQYHSSLLMEPLISLPTNSALITVANVKIDTSVPPDATNLNVRMLMGSWSYAPENDAFVWKINYFPGFKEYMLRAQFSLHSVTPEESGPERKAPFRVKFKIPYFIVSGIQFFCGSSEQQAEEESWWSSDSPKMDNVLRTGTFSLRYQKVVEVYEIARQSLNNNFLKYGRNRQLLNSGICKLHKNDVVAINNALE